MANELIHTLDNDSFKNVVSNEVLTLVDFWAPWCGPCKMVAPTLDDLADEYQGRVQIAKLNVDENQALSVEHGVEGIPCFVLFQNGKEVDRMVGAYPKSAFRKFLDRHAPALQEKAQEENAERIA